MKGIRKTKREHKRQQLRKQKYEAAQRKKRAYESTLRYAFRRFALRLKKMCRTAPMQRIVMSDRTYEVARAGNWVRVA